MGREWEIISNIKAVRFVNHIRETFILFVFTNGVDVLSFPEIERGECITVLSKSGFIPSENGLLKVKLGEMYISLGNSKFQSVKSEFKDYDLYDATISLSTISYSEYCKKEEFQCNQTKGED